MTLLKHIYRQWLRLGAAMGRVINPLVLTLVYLLAILPTALLMKALGKDPMHRRFEPKLSSYWIKRSVLSSMKDMF